MTHVALYAAPRSGMQCRGAAEALFAAYENFKGLKLSRPVIHSNWNVGYAPRATGAGGDGILVFPAGGFLTWVGTWIHPAADPADLVGWLSKAWVEKGASQLARELSGQFVLFRIAHADAELEMVTDRCGSLHVFERRDADGVAIATSSAALARHGRVDPLGIQEFVATGNVYGSRTIWDNVRKLPAASVIEVGPAGTRSHRYWHLQELEFGGLGLAPSVDRLYFAIKDEASAVARLYPKVLADLTGGYDSRLLFSGLMAAGVQTSSTVSGVAEDPDAVVAARLAALCGVPHTRVVRNVSPDYPGFLAAVRLTDAEADAFEYSGVAGVHSKTAKDFSVAVGGSFGEIARGYWWELLWPRIGKRIPLDINRLSKARFLTEPLGASLFRSNVRVDLANHLSGLLSEEIADMAHFPNTAQMDCVYLGVRMQRWQGRLASSTAQLRPCLSPLAAGPILESMLEASPSSRIRSRLVRELFAVHQPSLASVPLEHGYQPVPFRWTRPQVHAPLLGYYGKRLINKAARMTKLPLPGRRPYGEVNGLEGALVERYPELFAGQGVELLTGCALLETGVFDELALTRLLGLAAQPAGAEFAQWRRVVTLEQGLRLVNRARN